MNISNEIIDEIKIFDENIYENIPNSFQNAININPQFEREIHEIYIRTLENYGKTTLNAYHLKYMEMFNFLSQYYDRYDKELIEFADSLIRIINIYFKELDAHLNINSQKDLDELKYILQISLILMEEGIEEKNIELAYESFFQIERRIKKQKLYKKSIHIYSNEDYEILISIPEKPIINEDNSVATLKLKEPINNDFGGKVYEL